VIFGTPSALWLLPVALALVWYLVRFRRRADPALGYSMVSDLKDLESPAAVLWTRVRPWLRGVALVILILGLARPQQGLKGDERDVQATDIILCLDVSETMRAGMRRPRRGWTSPRTRPRGSSRSASTTGSGSSCSASSP
jgi:Ca-activated chloride channel family protein